MILTSVAEKDQAHDLAKKLVESELAACVQISSKGTSFYRWQGEVEQADEVFISIKTTVQYQQAVMEWLETFHPYDVPEIICLDATTSGAYAEWMLASVK
ncbi:MAG: divalent-cation tolerance protein CutA [Mariprofundaceae bacterium]